MACQEALHSCTRGKNIRLRAVPIFSSGIVERAKRDRAWKSPQSRKSETRWGNFHARSCFARSTIPEEIWGQQAVYQSTRKLAWELSLLLLCPPPPVKTLFANKSLIYKSPCVVCVWKSRVWEAVQLLKLWSVGAFLADYSRNRAPNAICSH